MDGWALPKRRLCFSPARSSHTCSRPTGRESTPAQPYGSAPTARRAAVPQARRQSEATTPHARCGSPAVTAVPEERLALPRPRADKGNAREGTGQRSPRSPCDPAATAAAAAAEATSGQAGGRAGVHGHGGLQCLHLGGQRGGLSPSATPQPRALVPRRASEHD